MKRGKLRKILTLADPPPNWRYEIGCYLQSSAACLLVAIGLVSLLFCFSLCTLVSSTVLLTLGGLLLSRLKIIRELIKILKER